MLMKHIITLIKFGIDQVWGYLRNVRKPGCISFEYNLLFEVAEVVLTILHSNAGEEHIFSLIHKNNTPSRSSLNLQSTLSSLPVIKTHIENMLQWKPSEELLQKTKKSERTQKEVNM